MRKKLTTEELFRDKKDGHVLNPSFMDYKIPTSMDIPLKNKDIFVESIDPDGPFGAKEVSEGGEHILPPAVFNYLLCGHKATCCWGIFW